MVNKLIKGIDDEVWRKFVAFCKIKNVRVGNELESLLESYLKKNMRKIV